MRDYTRCGRQIQCIPLKCNACGREVMIPGLPAGRPLHLGPHPDKAILMAGMGSSQNASPSGRGGEQCVAIFAITPFPSVPPVPPKLRGYRNPCRLSRPACAGRAGILSPMKKSQLTLCRPVTPKRVQVRRAANLRE